MVSGWWNRFVRCVYRSGCVFPMVSQEAEERELLMISNHGGAETQRGRGSALQRERGHFAHRTLGATGFGGLEVRERTWFSFSLCLRVSVVLFMNLFARAAMACSICVVDPNSPMTHGAKAAVWFMLGVIGVVLGSIVAVTLFFYRRAQLLARQATFEPHHES